MRKKLFLLILFVYLFHISNVSATSIKTMEIDIYKVSDKYSYLEMPSSFKEEEKIEIIGASGAVHYYPKGNITVSNDGVVKMKPSVSSINGNKIYKYYEEDAEVEIHVGSEIFHVVVHAHLYENYWAKKVMNDYIKENITNDMTEKEKMEHVMNFLSMTKYSSDSTSYADLILGDGANCIGDSRAILYMCEILGIEAHMRDAGGDMTAASLNHVNVAAILDKKLYVIDIISTGAPPRETMIRYSPNGFYIDNFGVVVQYDGYDEIAYVPEGAYINKIAGFAFYWGEHSETKLKEVHVPSTITTFENGAFSGISTLEKVVIDPNNLNYKNIGNNVYSKDGSILYSYPAGQKGEEFIVLNGVKEIAAATFYGTKLLKQVILPNGLQKIGENAFKDSAVKEVIIPASVIEIEDRSFEDVELIIKSRNIKLGQGLCNSSVPIHGYKNSTVEEYAKENNCPFIEIPISDVLKGDMDQNEIIEIYDVMELLYIISEKKEKTDFSIEIGDMDDSGDIDIFDVMELLYIYTGKK